MHRPQVDEPLVVIVTKDVDRRVVDLVVVDADLRDAEQSLQLHPFDDAIRIYTTILRHRYTDGEIFLLRRLFRQIDGQEGSTAGVRTFSWVGDERDGQRYLTTDGTADHVRVVTSGAAAKTDVMIAVLTVDCYDFCSSTGVMEYTAQRR